MPSIKNITRYINLYPPYLGAGISLKSFKDDCTKFEVQLKKKWYNNNAVGTHFGGSLYSMCDPFYMFILMENLGKDYIVWDKAAAIQFKKPGVGTVTAIFEIPKEEISRIKAEVDEKGKGDFTFHTQILNEGQAVVAEVEKVIYVRKKSFRKQ